MCLNRNFSILETATGVFLVHQTDVYLFGIYLGQEMYPVVSNFFSQDVLQP